MANATYRNVQQAALLSHELRPKGELITSQLQFRVPLDYTRPGAGMINLSATMVHARGTGGTQNDGKYLRDNKPIFVFLCGGPGSGNDPFSMPALNHALLTGTCFAGIKFQILYLDYRGTGRSTPIGAATLAELGPVQKQAEYLKLFRQDNIVRDLEAVRKCLSAKLWQNESRPWSIMGQSYGGWIAITYLSFCPEGLKEVFLAGAMAPIGKKPTDVYMETYNQVRKQNIQFYRIPKNKERVGKIVQHLVSKGNSIPLPSGGRLTVQRFMLLGRSFGSTDGLIETSQLLGTTTADIASGGGGGLTQATLDRVDKVVKFGGRPLYAALHEAIYCDGSGVVSNWAADRVGVKHPASTGAEYAWLWRDAAKAQADTMFFAGEMIYPFHFDTFAELGPFKDVAERLAKCDDWPALYDRGRLSVNTVPACAVGYRNDMYVSAKFGKETSEMIKGAKYYESPDLAHDAIRTNTNTVLQHLAQMSQGP